MHKDTTLLSHLRLQYVSFVDVNDAPTNIEISKDSSLEENSVEDVFISHVIVIDEDKNTKPSCKLLDSNEDRVKLNSLTLLVGANSTDYESLDSSKSLKINISCEDQYGIAINMLLVIPIKGKVRYPSQSTL